MYSKIEKNLNKYSFAWNELTKENLESKSTKKIKKIEAKVRKKKFTQPLTLISSLQNGRQHGHEFCKYYLTIFFAKKHSIDLHSKALAIL